MHLLLELRLAEKEVIDILSVHPNPASTRFTVSGIKAPLKITEIFDMKNKLIQILKGDIRNESIPITFPTGIYLIKVTDINDKIYFKKLAVIQL